MADQMAAWLVGHLVDQMEYYLAAQMAASSAVRMVGQKVASLVAHLADLMVY